MDRLQNYPSCLQLSFLSSGSAVLKTCLILAFTTIYRLFKTECRKKRVKGVEPSSLAWKAMALPLSYTRSKQKYPELNRPSSSNPFIDFGRPISWLMGGAGFEPAKALPSDLQSDPFDRSGNPPLAAAGCARNPFISTERRPVTLSFRSLRSLSRELAEGLEPTTC